MVVKKKKILFVEIKQNHHFSLHSKWSILFVVSYEAVSSTKFDKSLKKKNCAREKLSLYVSIRKPHGMYQNFSFSVVKLYDNW